MKPRVALLASLGAVAVVGVPAAAWLLASAPRKASHLSFSNEGTDLAATDVEAALQELSRRVKQVEGGQQALQGAALVQQGHVGTVERTVEEHRLANEARISALETRLSESITSRKRLEYSDGASSAAIGANYSRLRDIGQFSKLAANTTVLLTWNTHVDAMGEPGTFCDFQLRIDGKPDEEQEGGGGRAVVYVPPNAAGGSAPVTVSALFGRVGPGQHTVGVFLRGTSRECLENYGNFPRAVIVEEGPRAP
ncbi:MAG TPA: hypothetical protein VMT17_02325 [Anaeromyxobacteraceae bacterium]|nr:hypothetical protein [Anaeromyxobacteraceae bacterium]